LLTIFLLGWDAYDNLLTIWQAGWYILREMCFIVVAYCFYVILNGLVFIEFFILIVNEYLWQIVIDFIIVLTFDILILVRWQTFILV